MAHKVQSGSYFKDYKEETSHNRKGTLIEFKAYGKSDKQDREVISFEGRFYDDLLTNWEDKTGTSSSYGKHGAEKDKDVLPNNLSLLALLIQNDCFDVFSEFITKDIVERVLNSISNEVDRLEKAMKDGKFTYHPKGDVFYLEDREQLEEKLKDIENRIKAGFVFNPGFADSSWTPDMIQRLSGYCPSDMDNKLFARLALVRKVAAGRIAEAKKRGNANLRGNDLALLAELTREDALKVLPATTVSDILGSELYSIKALVGRLEKVVEEATYTYDPENELYYLNKTEFDIVFGSEDKVYLQRRDLFKDWFDGRKFIPLSEIEAKLSTTKSYLGYTDAYSLDDLIRYLKDSISSKYVLSAGYSEPTWTKEMIGRLRNYCAADHDKQLFSRLDAIKKKSADRITAEKVHVRSQNRKAALVTTFKYLMFGIALFIGYVFFTTSDTMTFQERALNAVGLFEPPAEPVIVEQEVVEPTVPGTFYVSEDALQGLTLYKDVKKQKKRWVQLKAMEDIYIVHEEDSMGYFESHLMDDAFTQWPAGWVEMKYLVPRKLFYTYENGMVFRVKSDQSDVPIYTNHLKGKKRSRKLQSMEQITIYKIRGKMGYFKGLPIQYDIQTMSGWVEMDKIQPVAEKK